VTDKLIQHYRAIAEAAIERDTCEAVVDDPGFVSPQARADLASASAELRQAIDNYRNATR